MNSSHRIFGVGMRDEGRVGLHKGVDTMAIEARKVVLESVSDASGLAALIDEGVFDADGVIAVVGKTEGNGGVNDFTRILADQAFRKVLMDKGTRPYEEVKEIPMVWSGGTDGILCPHATIFAKVPDSGPASGEPRLAVGYAMSDVILPELCIDLFPPRMFLRYRKRSIGSFLSAPIPLRS